MRVDRRCGELKVCWGPTPQHISLHLPHYPPHILSPHANTLPHSPHTLSHTSPLPTHLSLPSPRPQHISLHLPPHPHISSHSFPDLPLHPNTLPYSPHALSHTSLPTSYPTVSIVAKLPSNSKIPIKFFIATGNLKSCLGVGNVNFRCMKVWRSYHVAKLLWRSYHVAKLLATVSKHLVVPCAVFKHFVGLKVPCSSL